MNPLIPSGSTRTVHCLLKMNLSTSAQLNHISASRYQSLSRLSRGSTIEPQFHGLHPAPLNFELAMTSAVMTPANLDPTPKIQISKKGFVRTLFVKHLKSAAANMTRFNATEASQRVQDPMYKLGVSVRHSLIHKTHTAGRVILTIV